MRRLTVTVDDALLRRARDDVAAGRAESISAWVADAMRKKARALEELLDEIDELNRETPPSPRAIETVARSLGRSSSWVVRALAEGRRRRR